MAKEAIKNKLGKDYKNLHTLARGGYTL